MTQLDGLAGWGQIIRLTGATEVVDVTTVNVRTVILAGRNGVQTISIPNSTALAIGARLMVVAVNANVSGAKPVNITDGMIVVQLTSPNTSAELLWSGTAWQRLVGGTQASVAWTNVTSKPSLVEATGATDGTVPNGTGAGTYAWTSTPKLSTVRVANSIRETTVPAQTRLRAFGDALESYDTARFQRSVSPVTSYGGTDRRASTGIREYVHVYQSASSAAQTIDFDLTYVTSDYLLTSHVMMAKFKAEIIGNIYAGGTESSLTSTYESNGYVSRDPLSGRFIVQATSAISYAVSDNAAWSFAWTYPSDATLRLTATPGGSANSSLAVSLRVFATYGYGPHAGI